MIRLTLMLCCFIGVTFSASLLDHSANQELARYMYRSKIIHQRLLAEGCADVTAAVRAVRSVLSVKWETQIEIEKLFYNELTDMLIRCRQAKQSETNTDEPIATQTTTTPTTTTPTTPTTSPTSMSPANARITATTTPTIIDSPIIDLTTIPATPLAQQAALCQRAINLTEQWRSDHNGTHVVNNCDNRDMEAAGRPWFRFAGAAGTRLLDHCVPGYSCGTHIALWSDEVMPTRVGVITRFYVFGSYEGDCKSETLESSVMRCSYQPNDLVYRWEVNNCKKFSCHYGFCGMNGNI